MKIELKRIQYYARQSEETIAFNADLYIEGKKVGEASNNGHGGSTDYGSYTEEGRKIIKEAEQYCKTLPPEKYELDGKPRELECNLERIIDGIIGDFVNEKELQKFRNLVKKKCIKSLVIGKPDKAVVLEYRYKVPIQQILSGVKGAGSIAKALIDIIPDLINGNMLLNTNIPTDILKSAGLKEEQYIAQNDQVLKNSAKNQKQNKGKSI